MALFDSSGKIEAWTFDSTASIQQRQQEQDRVDSEFKLFGHGKRLFCQDLVLRRMILYDMHNKSLKEMVNKFKKFYLRGKVNEALLGLYYKVRYFPGNSGYLESKNSFNKIKMYSFSK
jgi:hypothetical protein